MTPRRRRKTRNPPGQGGVFQRRDGRWVAKIVVAGTSRIRYANDRATAEGYLAQLRADAGIPPDALITVRDYLARWLRSVEHSVRSRVYDQYDLNVRRWTALLGDVRLHELSADQIEAGQRTMLTQGIDVRIDGRGRLPRPLSAQTVKQAHTVLHTALQYAVDPPRRWLVHNPVAGAAIPRPAHREMLTLTDEQLRTLFTRTADHELHALLVLLATAGLRVGEALGLRWGDVDWKASRVSIAQQMQRQRGKGNVVEAPKERRSSRPVRVPPSTLTVLRDHQRGQGATQLQALVFCRPNGSPLDAASVRRRFKTITKRLELPPVRIHDLRHSYATALLGRGIHPKIVQELMGHATIEITMGLYSHVLEGMGRAAADSLEDLFSTPLGVDTLSIDAEQ